VCEELATVTDWRPRLNWLVVENCPCIGFFVWGPLWEDGRLTRLTAEDRNTLIGRIRDHRARQSEAWLTTRSGAVTGALIIRDARPDRV
jgi:hypothetical protein